MIYYIFEYTCLYKHISMQAIKHINVKKKNTIASFFFKWEGNYHKKCLPYFSFYILIFDHWLHKIIAEETDVSSTGQ